MLYLQCLRNQPSGGSMFNIKIEKYPKGDYYVSANQRPEFDCFLINLHKKYNEYAIVRNGINTLWSSFDIFEKWYKWRKHER